MGSALTKTQGFLNEWDKQIRIFDPTDICEYEKGWIQLTPHTQHQANREMLNSTEIWFSWSFCCNQLAQLIDQQSTRPSTTLCHVLDLLRFYDCVPLCTLLSVPWYTVVLPAWYTVVCTLWNPLKANRISWWNPKDEAWAGLLFFKFSIFVLRLAWEVSWNPNLKTLRVPPPYTPSRPC